MITKHLHEKKESLKCRSARHSVTALLSPSLRHDVAEDGGGLRRSAGNHHGLRDGGVCEHGALPDVHQVRSD